jgi:hypothetical protein
VDVLLLGAFAVVLIAITVWLVLWPQRAGEPSPEPEAVEEEAADLPPSGDAFEDQYTSATADLSAGGVAAARAEGAEVDRREEEEEAWRATPAPFDEVSTAAVEPQVATGPTPKSVGLGAAALLTLAGAVAGAWLYARWERERDKPINRIRRQFRR